jgi:hypothetical protein
MSREGRIVGLCLFAVAGLLFPARAELLFPASFTPEMDLTTAASSAPSFDLNTSFSGALCLESTSHASFTTGSLLKELPVLENENSLSFLPKNPGRSEWDRLWIQTASIPIQAVPEPTTFGLLGAGAFLFLARRYRRN